MTSEVLYEILEQEVNKYLDENSRLLSMYDVGMPVFQDLGLGRLITYANTAKQTKDALAEIQIKPFATDLSSLYRSALSREYEDYYEKLQKAQMRMDADKQTIRERKEKELKEVKSRLKQVETVLQEKISPIKEKHFQLVSTKKDKVKELMQLYKIPEVVSIDFDEMQLSDISDVLDVADYVAEDSVGTSSFTDKVLSIFYYPIIGDFPNKQTAQIVKISHFVTLVILGYLLKPYFFGVVGFFYIVHFLSRLLKVAQRKRLLQISAECMHDINFERFKENDVDYIKAQKAIEEVEGRSYSDEYSRLQKEYEENIERLEKENPDLKLEEFKQVATSEFENISDVLETATFQSKNAYDKLLFEHEQHIERLDRHFEAIKSATKFLGSEISTSKVLNTKFKVGMATYKNEVVTEATIDLPLENMVFTYRSDTDKHEMINYMKLLLCNALSNVREKYMKVTIFDPNDLGKDFSEFIVSKEASAFINVRADDFSKLYTELADETTKNLKVIGKRGVQEFNRIADEAGKVTIDYHLVIILPTENPVWKEQKFTALKKYSALYGVWIWSLINDTPPDDKSKEDSEMFFKFFKDMVVSTKPGETVLRDGTLRGGFTAPLELYQYDERLGERVMQIYEKALIDGKIDVLPYETVKSRHIPDDKIWTYSTRHGIELHPGLLDGDPSNFLPHLFGDDTVHALMGGATGQGKSATINEMLASMLMMYPPEELEMVMVDFKNVEFSMYTGELLIPHAKIIAGTKDGEYALSVFDYLLDEMRRREKLFSANKVQKIAEHNDLMEKLGRKSEILPRVFVLIDEFQVMFTEVEPKMVDKIKERITSLSKLARFAGCHMFFTSQSMKNTMSADILEQFKLRLSLFATKETSTDLLGNPAASTIKGKGWIYTNDSGAQNEKNNRLFRVPFCSNSYIKEYLPKLIKKGQEEGRLHRNAVFYDEEKIHDGKELIDLYKREQGLHAQGTMILGERTMYSLNPLPFGSRIIRDDNEHMLVTAFERKSMLGIINTIIENLKARDVDFFAHTPDRETMKLLNLQNRVVADYSQVVEAVIGAEDALDLFEMFINMNQEAMDENPDVAPPERYFLGLNWDKLNGLGVAENFRTQDRFKALLQKAGICNVHFVVVVRDSSQFYQFATMFNHKIVGKSMEKESLKWLESNKAQTVAEMFAYYVYGSDITKFKIYDFPLFGEIVSREVKIC